MHTIRVRLPGGGAGRSSDRSYDVVCGSGLLATAGGRLRAAGASRAVVMADAAVADSHAARVLASLRTAGLETHAIAIPSGEGSKAVDVAARLWDACAAVAVDRSTHVVAVGGGVAGDLVGFVAATFGRGLPLWHVPTTLVAQVDSSIGGKTGINLAAGKNLVGCFWQPIGVLADVETLATLPDREFVSGLAEVVKYGMIFDAGFLGWLEEHADALVGRDPQAVTAAVARSAGIKARVVEQDERELEGLRASLNYGHTFAHAYETVAGYGTLLHGEAVAIGMARAARLAQRIGRIGAEIVARQDRLLQRMRLPLAPPESLRDVAALLDVMRRDKKTVSGRMRFVLPAAVGRVDLVEGVDPEAVRAVLLG